jgi:hypothetical protein
MILIMTIYLVYMIYINKSVVLIDVRLNGDFILCIIGEIVLLSVL